MTSATHDDRIEVLSVAGVAVVAPPSQIMGATAGAGKRGSVRGHRTTGSTSGVGTISGGAVGGSTGGGGHRNSVHRNSSMRSSQRSNSQRSHGDRRASSSGGPHHGGSMRRHGSGHGRHHSTASTSSVQQPTETNHHPGPRPHHDSRRGTGSRGYTYLVPSPDDQVKALGGGPGDSGGNAGLHPLMQKEPKTESQKRVARIVMVLATTMLLMSLLLVGITLSMSDHIDEMGRCTLFSDLIFCH